MANSTQYQKLVDKRLSGAHAPLTTPENSGVVRTAYAYTGALSSTGAAVYDMFELPANAVLLDGFVSYPAGTSGVGSGTSVEVGHDGWTQADGTSVAADDNKFLESANTQTAAGASIPILTAHKFGKLLKLDADSTADSADRNFVKVTLTTTGSGTASGNGIELVINYVLQ